MKRESLEKRKLSAERIEEADEGLFALERERESLEKRNLSAD